MYELVSLGVCGATNKCVCECVVVGLIAKSKEKRDDKESVMQQLEFGELERVRACV